MATFRWALIGFSDRGYPKNVLGTTKVSGSELIELIEEIELIELIELIEEIEEIEEIEGRRQVGSPN